MIVMSCHFRSIPSRQEYAEILRERLEGVKLSSLKLYGISYKDTKRILAGEGSYQMLFRLERIINQYEKDNRNNNKTIYR